jgi:hypothetical protein
MGAWRLFRHYNPDGSSKDWAVKTNLDASISTRWGKTATHLPSLSTRHNIRQLDIEREKQAKGYKLIAEVDIDNDGKVYFLGDPMPVAPKPPMTVLYWHIECRDSLQPKAALRSALAKLRQVVQHHNHPPWTNPPLFDVPDAPGRFSCSGQLRSNNGLLPFLLLMALKHNHRLVSDTQ